MKCKLSDVCDLVAGYAFKGKDFGDYEDKVIKITHIKNMRVDMEHLEGVDLTDYNRESLKRYIASEGDYLLAMTGATIGKLGRITNGSAYVNQRVLLFRPKKDVSKDFLYYVLCQQNFTSFVRNYVDSESAQANISANTIGKYEVKLPPLETQRKIASILSSLDDKIELNDRINANLEEQARAIFKKYCEETEKTIPLSRIMRFENGFAFQSQTYLPSGAYKIITIKNVQDGRIDSSDAACVDELPPKINKECILKSGDVLLSLTGNVGRVGIVCEENLLLNQRVAKVVPYDKANLPLLYFMLRLPSMKTRMETIAKGTAQSNLSPVETSRLEIPYEERSASELSHNLFPMYAEIVRNGQENLRLSSLRDALLPRLLSGELDVSKLTL